MSSNFRFKKIFFLPLILIALIILNGCVKRMVTIESDPPGASVFFNNESEEKGTTPCTFDFTFYGTIPLKLVKKGYEDLNTTVYLKAPAYEYFPVDFFSEIILPNRLNDKHSKAYKLTAIKEEAE